MILLDTHNRNLDELGAHMVHREDYNALKAELDALKASQVRGQDVPSRHPAERSSPSQFQTHSLDRSQIDN